METSLDYYQWVTTHLHLDVSKEAVDAFSSLDEESLHYVMQQSDDMIRMVLLCMERVIQLGGTVNNWNRFELNGHELNVMLFNNMFCIAIGKKVFEFTMNHYGQIQLDEWLYRLEEL